MIIDAKYKNYTCFGKTSEHGIQRDDLYQMSTYLYHYGKKDKAIAGVFTSPVACSKDDIHSFSENRNHYIGLINLNIAGANDNVAKVHDYETEYVDEILNLLNTLH